MSFLQVFDRAAGAIKSGGTTRRAAKMVSLDIDHPDIEAFIGWKAAEERKAKLLIQHGGYPADFNGEAYSTVSGQNSNNSVRVSEEFLRAVEANGEWELIRRTDGTVSKVLPARHLWGAMSEAAWACADPGVQFDTTINEWHTCPESGRINASNPCSEYMFLDNTACNLASVNLTKFLRRDVARAQEHFDVEGFRHAARLWTVVLDISQGMAGFPSREIAERSHQFRTVGLGYCGLGALLMRSGIPYDSERGRAMGSAITAVMTGESYATSAELARELGPYPSFEENREHHLRVARNHRRVAFGAREFEGLSIRPKALDEKLVPSSLLHAAREAWDFAIEGGQEWGYRNAQVTCIAPTGTIGLLMDADTTGPEPVYALLATKKLAGGGCMPIATRSVAPGLRSLGYSDKEAAEILSHLEARKTLSHAPHLELEHRAVFASANEIPWRAHLEAMAAIQSFISGAISKTVNMPQSATAEDISGAYLMAWKLGLKSLAVYRDGSKQAQVLEATKPSEYEPPVCVTCGEGSVCEAPTKREKGPWSNIPLALRRLRFVAYGLDKVPLEPKSGRAASVMRPETWGSFEEALGFVEKSPRALGPGLVLRQQDRVVCLDLDSVIDPARGVSRFAEELVERFSTYTEISLSKRGLHLFFTVKDTPDFPGGRWRTKEGHPFEVYHTSRYIALTGTLFRFSGAGTDIEERTASLRRLIAESTPAQAKTKQPIGGRHTVNKEAMLAIFHELGVAVDGERRTLARCFLPKHDDHRPSLSVDPERGWFCFGCREGGGAVRLREIVRGFSNEDLKRLSERTGAPESGLLALRERLREGQNRHE